MLLMASFVREMWQRCRVPVLKGASAYKTLLAHIAPLPRKKSSLASLRGSGFMFIRKFHRLKHDVFPTVWEATG